MPRLPPCLHLVILRAAAAFSRWLFMQPLWPHDTDCLSGSPGGLAVVKASNVEVISGIFSHVLFHPYATGQHGEKLFHGDWFVPKKTRLFSNFFFFLFVYITLRISTTECCCFNSTRLDRAVWLRSSASSFMVQLTFSGCFHICISS